MARIFISYRRADSRKDAGRLYDRLVQEFGKENIFKDVDNIPLGSDFRKVLADAVNRCDVFLALIGSNWLTILDENGNRRIDDPDDFVRIEIQTALARENCLVIPVMLDDTPVPKIKELPDGLKELSYKNAIPIRDDPDFHKDMSRLVTSIQEKFSESVQKTTQQVKNSSPDVALLSKNSKATKLHLKFKTEYVLPDSISRLVSFSIVRFSFNGNHLITGLSQDQVILWDFATGKMLHVNSPKQSSMLASGASWGMRCIAISCDDNFIASPIHKTGIQIWEAKDLKPYKLLQMSETPTYFDFSKDGEWLIVGFNDGRLSSWSLVDNYRHVEQMNLHGDSITRIQFNPSKLDFAIGYTNGNITLCTIEEEEIKEVGLFEGHDRHHVLELVFSPNGKSLFSGSHSGELCFWNAGTRVLLKNIQAYKQPIRALAVSPNGELLVSSSNDNTLRIHHTETFEPLLKKKFDSPVNSAHFSPDNLYLALTTQNGRGIQIWELGS